MKRTIGLLFFVVQIACTQSFYQTFTWTKVQGATQYELLVARSFHQVKIVFDDTTLVDTVKQVLIPSPGVYFWKIKSYAGAWSKWSDTSSIGFCDNFGQPNVHLKYYNTKVDTNWLPGSDVRLGYLGTPDSKGKVPARFFRVIP